MIVKTISMNKELWDALAKEAKERGGMSVNALVRYYCMRGMIEFDD